MKVVQIKDGFSSYFVIQDKRPMLVDTGNVGDFQKKLSDISATGVNPKDISLILLTHSHYDHFGNVPGNERIYRRADCRA